MSLIINTGSLLYSSRCPCHHCNPVASLCHYKLLLCTSESLRDMVVSLKVVTVGIIIIIKITFIIY